MTFIIKHLLLHFFTNQITTINFNKEMSFMKFSCQLMLKNLKKVIFKDFLCLGSKSVSNFFKEIRHNFVRIDD